MFIFSIFFFILLSKWEVFKVGKTSRGEPCKLALPCLTPTEQSVDSLYNSGQFQGHMAIPPLRTQ